MMKIRNRVMTPKFLLKAAVLFFLILAAANASAVTADEEAARIAGLAAMEPARREWTAVQPLIAIEKTWDIEDTHTASGVPLADCMEFANGELGYDRNSRTFYASIGMNCAEWPELGLMISGADGLQAAWVDDYAWDEPAAAVRDGTLYRLIAWTDTAYEYINVVFTGLPMMVIHTKDSAEPGSEYGPCLAGLAADGYEPVQSVAQIHTRGGGARESVKKSYRLEFAEQKAKHYGYKKRSVSLLGMPEDTDWILLSNDQDEETLLRNLVGFRLWTEINDDEVPAFARLQGYLVELCLNDQYEGVYTIQQRVKPKRELLENGFTEEDYAARLILFSGIEDRPVNDVGVYFDNTEGNYTMLELRYQPEGRTSDDCFAVYRDFLLLCDRRDSLDDETFLKTASEHLDMRQLMRSFLFYEGALLCFDNIRNNVYIWAVQKDGKLLYYFSPWDMDQGFQFTGDVIKFNAHLAVRLLDLNAPGVRSFLWEEWRKMRSGPLSDDEIYKLCDEMRNLQNNSGAFERERNRWGGYENSAGIESIQEFLLEHLPDLENQMMKLWPEE